MSMYVTRRFLRSTLSPTASETERSRKSTPTEVSCEAKDRTAVNAVSPRRRAPLRASKSSDEVRAPEAASTASASKAPAASTPKSSGSRKKHASPRTSSGVATTTAASPQIQGKPFVGVGQFVDARDAQERWCEAKILRLDALKHEAFVHYVGWNARYDAWLPVPFLAAHGSHTGDSRRNEHSWNGETSLFRREGEREPSERSSPVTKALKKEAKLQEKKKTKTKKSAVATSPVASRKRRSRMVLDDDDDDAAEQATSGDASTREAASQKPKRAKRSQRGAVAATAKTEDTSGAGGKTPKTETKPQAKAEKATAKALKKTGKAKREAVRVVVATTDEASERKARRSRKAPVVDMELDMDVRGDASDDDNASSKDASDAKGASPEPKTKAKKPKREPKSRLSTSRKSVPLVRPPAQLSETREKLAAIFRLRLQQRHELEALVRSCGSDAPGASEPTMDVTSAPVPTGPKPRQSRAPAQQQQHYDAAALDEAYAHYQNVQQLQQYYYQQAMLASSRSLASPDSDDPSRSSSPDALTGGVMDPRVIQARMDALERQRQQLQQQQLHDYYQHVAIARERNCHALAANDAFLAASSTTWQQQQQQQTQGPPDEDASMDDAEASSPTASTPPADVAALEAQLETSATLASPDRSAADTSASAETVGAPQKRETPGDIAANELSVERSAARGCSEKRRDGSDGTGNVLYEFVL